MRTGSRLFAVILLLGMVCGVLAAPIETPQAHAAPHVPGLVQIGGVLSAAPGSTTAPATLMVSTGRRLFTVQVSAGTSLVRREGARASLTEFAVNDRMRVVGERLGPGLIQAVQVQDLSIEGVSAQHALITGITSTSISVTAVPAPAGTPPTRSRRGPLPVNPPYVLPAGQSLVLPVSVSTAVTANGGTEYGSTTGLVPNAEISFSGVFDLQSHTFTVTSSITVVGGPPIAVGVREQGYLVTAPAGVTAPVTLSLQTSQGLITVNVGTSTAIVRRFGGQSGLDELSANDQLVVTGSLAGPTVVNAVRIQDLSIQAAYTTLIGAILQVGQSSIQVLVQQDPTHRSPFHPGQIFTLPVGSATKVTIGTSTTTGSTAGLMSGQQVTALGVYNRTGTQFQATFSIRVRSVSRTYTGFLVVAPTSTTAPATLVLQLGDGQQVQVQILPSTVLVRRYNGTSGLDELSTGDQLVITGQQSGTQPLVATRIRDNSLQAAYTTVVGRVTASNSTAGTITLLVQHDVYNRSPLRPGQMVTLVIGPSTRITLGTTTATGTIGSLPPGATITALGVYDRSSSTFVSTARIRIHS